MFSKKPFDFRTSLVFQLTFWYFCVFSLSQLAIFFSSYFILKANAYHRCDDSLRHEVEETASLFSLHGIDAVREAMIRETYAEGTDQTFYRLLDAQGEALAASDLSAWGPIEASEQGLVKAKDANGWLETQAAPGTETQIRLIYARLSPGVVLQIGHTLSPYMQPVKEFQRLFGFITHIALICSVLIGYLLAKRFLAPIETVTSTAMTIASGHLESRVTVTSRANEVDRLAKAFNQMAERLQTLVTEIKEVNDNIAHDLRSPLTRIRGGADRILASRAACDDCQEMAVGIVEECAGLLKTINTMLDISEMNAGVANIEIETTDLAALSRDIADLFQSTAEEKGISLALKAPNKLDADADRQRIRNALINLLDNAVKYTESDGSIQITVEEAPDEAIIQVSDTGPGISLREQQRVFDRFYRGEECRSKQGNGLGLSLAASIASVHGGQLTLQSTPGEGSTFTLHLPRKSA